MGSIDIICPNLRSSPQEKNTSLNLFDEEDPYLSDCESGISGSENGQYGLIQIHNGSKIYERIKKSLNRFGFNAQVEAIQRKDYSAIMSQAKLKSFCIYKRAMEIKCGGNANMRCAWFGGSKNEIIRILSYGFGFWTSNPTHGLGVYLSPIDHPFESMQSAEPDEDGLKHMLLCRVILGKTEVIHPGSQQTDRSSEEFDSGVDNLMSPRKYIIWTSNMNTHILPEFVVSFRASMYCREFQTREPNSDWMPFPTLIRAISKYLPCDAVELIKKYYNDFKTKKIARFEMVQMVRKIAGDKLLMKIIKSYRGKVAKP